MWVKAITSATRLLCHKFSRVLKTFACQFSEFHLFFGSDTGFLFAATPGKSTTLESQFPNQYRDQEIVVLHYCKETVKLLYTCFTDQTMWYSFQCIMG